MSMQWWRSWHGAPMDGKWSVIAIRSGVKAGVVAAIAWELMDYASQNEERGSIEGFDPEVYAAFSGFSEDEIRAVIKAMEDKGIIKDKYLVNWLKRQPAHEDNSRARVTQFREKKRDVTQSNEMKRDVTQCNEMKRDVTQCNAPDIDTDKDTDTEETYTPTDAEKIYREITGQVTLPAKADQYLDKILALIRGMGYEEAHRRLKAAWAGWITAKRKDNGLPYSRTSPYWIDYAVAGEVPRSNSDDKPSINPFNIPRKDE